MRSLDSSTSMENDCIENMLSTALLLPFFLGVFSNFKLLNVTAYIPVYSAFYSFYVDTYRGFSLLSAMQYSPQKLYISTTFDVYSISSVGTTTFSKKLSVLSMTSSKIFSSIVKKSPTFASDAPPDNLNCLRHSSTYFSSEDLYKSKSHSKYGRRFTLL